MKHHCSLAGFLVLFTAGQASADTPRGSSGSPVADVAAASRRPVSEKERHALVENGKRLTRDGQYPEALEVFREAIAVRPDPRVLLWMGYAQEQTGALLDARASYLEAKSVAHAGKLAAEERSSDQALTDIAAKIPRITIKLSSGVEAKVWIDDNEIQPSGEGAEVDPGAHRVVARAPGRRPYSLAVVAKAGEVSVVEPILTRIPPPPPEPPPPLLAEKVTSRSRAGVLVVGSVATGVALAMGTGFAVASEVKRRERDGTLCNINAASCDRQNTLERARGGFLTASLVSFLAAGAIGSGTLVYTLATRPDKAGGQVKATASVGTGGVGGAIEISW
jgi:hypothetical protein